MEVTQTDLAYLAGFIDGEGCITLGWHWTSKQKSKRYRYMQLRVEIANTDVGVLAWARGLFSLPSVLYTTKRQPRHWKPAHHLSWTGQNAVSVIQQVYPFLKIKKGQAEIALKFHETRVARGARRKGVPDDVQTVRDLLNEQLHVANARGVPR